MRAISRPAIFVTAHKLNEKGGNSENKSTQPTINTVKTSKNSNSYSNMFRRPILMNDLSSSISRTPIRNFVSQKTLENSLENSTPDLVNENEDNMAVSDSEPCEIDVIQSSESESASETSASESERKSESYNERDNDNRITSSYFSEANDLVDTAGPFVHSEVEEENYFLRDVPSALDMRGDDGSDNYIQDDNYDPTSFNIIDFNSENESENQIVNIEDIQESNVALSHYKNEPKQDEEETIGDQIHFDDISFNMLRCETKPQLDEAVGIINTAQTVSNEIPCFEEEEQNHEKNVNAINSDKKGLEDGKEVLEFSHFNDQSADEILTSTGEEDIDIPTERIELIEDGPSFAIEENKNYTEMASLTDKKDNETEEEEYEDNGIGHRDDDELPNLDEENKMITVEVDEDTEFIETDGSIAPKQSISPIILSSSRKHGTIEPCRFSVEIESLSMLQNNDLESENKEMKHDSENENENENEEMKSESDELDYYEQESEVISKSTSSKSNPEQIVEKYIDFESDFEIKKNAAFKEAIDTSIFDDVDYNSSSLFSSSSEYDSSSSASDSDEDEEDHPVRSIKWKKQKQVLKHVSPPKKLPFSKLRDHSTVFKSDSMLVSNGIDSISASTPGVSDNSKLMYYTIFLVVPSVSLVLIFIFKKFLMKTCLKFRERDI